MGISSFTCTVWACCRRLSSREKRLEQWHWKGRSPVCFLCEESCQYLILVSTRIGMASLPNVPRQMFASRKTQVTGWVIRAVEALRLFLLVGPRAIGVHAVLSIGSGVIVGSRCILILRVIQIHLGGFS